MPNLKQKVQIIVVIIALLISSQVLSTVISYISKEELTRSSDFVVLGQVKETKSVFNDTKSMIYTISTIEVESYIKGNNDNSEVNIITAGGKIGDIGMHVHGMPNFYQNEQVVVFLKNTNLNLSNFENSIPLTSINGFGLGKYSVYYDANLGAEMVYNNQEGLLVLDSNMKVQSKAISLDNFLEEITNYDN